MISSHTAFAALVLQNMGTVDMSSTNYSEYYYTSLTVPFSGTAAANASVTITVDGVANNTTADASGNWSYTHTFTQGAHTVAFAENGVEARSFTLNAGSSVPSTTTTTVGTGSSSPTTTLPDAGVGIYTIIFGLGGLILLAAPFVINKLVKSDAS